MLGTRTVYSPPNKNTRLRQQLLHATFGKNDIIRREENKCTPSKNQPKTGGGPEGSKIAQETLSEKLI